MPSTRALLAPALVLATIYVVSLCGLAFFGAWNSPLAALCLVTLAATPLLVAYAVLRRVSTRLEVLPHAMHVEPGFPRSNSIEVPYGLISSLVVKRGIGGHLSGSGTLVINMINGTSLAVCDLADAEAAANSIRAQKIDREEAANGASQGRIVGDRRVSVG